MVVAIPNQSTYDNSLSQFFMKKKFLPLLATSALTAAAIIPFGIGTAEAVSYYPTYTCYYRDIAGSCLSYQGSNPYLQNTSSYTFRSASPYGNRQTYPFNAMFNAASTNQSIWDNRYPNRHNFYYEEDDDDNDYYDDDDDYYDYHHDNDEGDGDWRYYYDEDDDTVRPYRYQSDNYYKGDYRYYDDDDDYLNYNATRYYCTGHNCAHYNRY